MCCRWVAGLVASAAFCTAVLVPMMGMPLYEPLAAVILALLVAVLAVRALGETDLNPVSGVGKLSQVCFSPICSAISVKHRQASLQRGIGEWAFARAMQSSGALWY